MEASVELSSLATPARSPLRDGAVSVLDRLRASTGAAHQELDRGLDLVRRLGVSDQRDELLGRYYVFHAGIEAAMAPLLGAMLAPRRRARLIAPHLSARPDAFASPPIITSRAGALGALYVVEGSTLGGRMILRGLRAQGIDTAALDFLHPYGAQTGAMWRDVLDLLERELADPAALCAGVQAAVATFGFARSCLAMSGVPAASQRDPSYV